MTNMRPPILPYTTTIASVTIASVTMYRHVEHLKY